MKKHMLLLCIVLAGILHSVDGTATSTLNCFEPGFLGKSYSFTCDTTGNISGIVWDRPGGTSVAACKPLVKCIPEDGYKTSIKGTQYRLHINTLEEKDAGTWKCTVGASDNETGSCTLNVSSQPSKMNCNITQLNASTLMFDLESYYCSSSARFRLLSSNGLSCDVKPSSSRQIVKGTCSAPSKWCGMVYPVMSCGGHEFNLTCPLAIGTTCTTVTAGTGSVSGTILLTVNKECVGLFLAAVRIVLYVR